jgi:hypothetical protein
MTHRQENALAKAFGDRLKVADEYGKKMNAMVRAGLKINSAVNPGAILEFLCCFACRLVNCAGGSAALYHMDRLVYRGMQDTPVECTFKRGEGISGKLMVEKKPFVCNLPQEDGLVSGFLPLKSGVKNFVSVPLLGGNGGFLGFFEVYNKQDFMPFNEHDVEMLCHLSSFASAALENASISTETQKTFLEIEKLAEEMSRVDSHLEKAGVKIMIMEKSSTVTVGMTDKLNAELNEFMQKTSGFSGIPEGCEKKALELLKKSHKICGTIRVIGEVNAGISRRRR